MNWREFWSGEHSIYVNARHRALHYDLLAKHIAALVPSPDAVLLDYGCGEALAADSVVRKCRSLMLFDAAPNVQDRLRRRFSGNERIIVLTAEALNALEPPSLDMIVCTSVLQYLGVDEFEAVLETWYELLRSNGRLVVADIVPPGLGALADAKALLQFAFEGGFFFPAVWGLARTLFSNYRKLRDEIGLSTYSEADMFELLSRYGFAPERAEHNIGHNRASMTFIATKRS